MKSILLSYAPNTVSLFNLKNFLRKIIYASLILLVFLAINCGSKTQNIDTIDLAGEDWSISLSDNLEYALPEISHSAWETVSLPNNINSFVKASDGAVWLRKNFEFNPDNFKGNPAVYLGKIYEKDQVYINGVLIGENGGREVNFGRKRIYPIPHSLLISGENTIAIRIYSSLSGSAGVISSPIAIAPFDYAWEQEWRFANKEFIYVSFFFFIAIFYLLNYLKMKDTKEYRSFSIFALTYCIYEFSRNDYRFNVYNNFLFFKFLEYATLFFIPYQFLRFVEEFLKFKKFKYSKLYFLLSASFVLLFAIIQKPQFWYAFVGYWDFQLPITLGYTIYLTFIRIREKVIGAYIQGIGLFYIFYAIIKQILIERGIANLESSLEASVLFYFFLMTIALRLQFLFVKRKIQKRYDQLREADTLRDKIFRHMEVMISKPLKHMHAILLEMDLLKDAKLKKEKIHEIENIQSTLQPLMDDIIELSRLEVMKEVPFKAAVPFVDFIKEVIPANSITYSIKVESDTLIENSLELINSIVIRLIDFPSIQDFTHNDLIITQDLRGNVHFRFLLFHSNPKIAIKVYNDLQNNMSLEDTNSIKWQIIKQIARLLEAKLELKIIKRKYLRIDLGLTAIQAPASELTPIKETKNKVFKNKTSKSDKPKQDWKDELKTIYTNIRSKLSKKK